MPRLYINGILTIFRQFSKWWVNAALKVDLNNYYLEVKLMLSWLSEIIYNLLKDCPITLIFNNT